MSFRLASVRVSSLFRSSSSSLVGSFTRPVSIPLFRALSSSPSSYANNPAVIPTPSDAPSVKDEPTPSKPVFPPVQPGTLELFYFALRGRAEQIRLLLNEAEIKYEDRLLTQWQLRKLKAAGSPISNPDFLSSQLASPLPFGGLPLLKDGDLNFAQTGAILQYIAQKGGKGLYPSDITAAARAHMLVAGAEDLFQNYWPIKLDQNRYQYHSGSFPLTPGTHQDYQAHPANQLKSPFDLYTVPRSFRRETLPRWLTFFEALLVQNQKSNPTSPFFLGSERTYVDIVLFAHIDAVLTIEPECLKTFPALKKNYETVKELKNIKKYLSKRPASSL